MASSLPANGAIGAPLPANQGPAKPRSPGAPDLTGRLAGYMAAGARPHFAAKVLLDAKHRRARTRWWPWFRGSRLAPGDLAIKFIRAQGGTPEGLGSRHRYQDHRHQRRAGQRHVRPCRRNDDVDPLTKAHPGSGVIPAALAMAEREQRSGMELIRAVALG